MTLFSLNFLIFVLSVVVLYYLLPKKTQQPVLLAASYIFYCWGTGWKGVGFIIFTTISAFFLAIRIERILDEYKRTAEGVKKKTLNIDKKDLERIKNENLKKRRKYLSVGLVANFGILAVMKYCSFLILDIDAFLTGLGLGGHLGSESIVLPLGISFYTFMTMGYLLDVHRDKCRAERNFLHFAVYTAYFPHIIQGPISRYKDVSESLGSVHYWSDENFRNGLLRVLWGYVKKIIIAERAGILVNEVFNNYSAAGYKGFVIFIAGLLYGFQIYADFSGGMDIILGISEILGIKLTENFRQPYYAKSVTEFWQRWHITLGAWMKNYIFYPMCLSQTAGRLQKKLKKKFGNYYGRVLIPSFASLISFIIVGIWHGADLKYVFYGFYMAVFVSTNTLLEQFYSNLRKRFKINPETKLFGAFQIVRTTVIIIIGRFFSRGNSSLDAVRMIRNMFSSFNIKIFSDGTLFNMGLDGKDWTVLIIAIALMLYVDYINEKGIRIREKISGLCLPLRWAVYYSAILAILIIGIYGIGYDASTFIYQNF